MKRYTMRVNYHNYAPFAENVDDRCDRISTDCVEWVRYKDAEKLQMRIIELEQQLKTQEQLKAEFEEDCHLDRVGGP